MGKRQILQLKKQGLEQEMLVPQGETAVPEAVPVRATERDFPNRLSGDVNLPLFDVSLRRSIMRLSSAVPRTSVSQTASD